MPELKKIGESGPAKLGAFRAFALSKIEEVPPEPKKKPEQVTEPRSDSDR